MHSCVYYSHWIGNFLREYFSNPIVALQKNNNIDTTNRTDSPFKLNTVYYESIHLCHLTNQYGLQCDIILQHSSFGLSSYLWDSVMFHCVQMLLLFSVRFQGSVINNEDIQIPYIPIPNMLNIFTAHDIFYYNFSLI